jgi:hypothetical protein
MNKPRAIDVSIAIVTAMVLLVLIPTRSDTTWVDPVTGSVKRQASWLIYQRTPVVEPSALERWIIRREGSHVPTWEHVSTSSWNCYGLPESVSLGHQMMNRLHAGERNDRFVRASTDEQLARFVQVLRTGSRAEREEAILAACELAAPSAGGSVR